MKQKNTKELDDILGKLIYLILINFVLSRKAAWIRSKMHFRST